MPRVPDSISELFNEYGSREAPTEKLITALHSFLKLVGEVYITIDALDEFSPFEGERESLLNFPTEFSTWALPNVHLRVTSQEIPEIKKKVQPLLSTPRICMKPGSDILKHVKFQLANDVSLAG